MTIKEQEDYWRKYAKQNTKMERLAYYVMLWAFRDAVYPVINSLESVGVQQTLDTLDGLFERKAIQIAYGKLYLAVGEKHKQWTDSDTRSRFTRKKDLIFKDEEDDKYNRRPKPSILTQTPVETNFGIGFYNPVWLARLKQIVNNIDVAERITSVTDTIKKDIRKSLQQAQQEFVSIRKITARLRRDLGIFSRRRAEVIARTEVTYIANEAAEQSAYEVAQEVGIKLKKIWIHTRDSRTRDSHRAVSSKPIDSNEAFRVGGKLMQKPGDPAGGASQVINCRCAIAYIPADDTEGFE
ncbi:phage minor head protein [Pedobacter sp.]|uniref:phage minor head protein n=1 Tax=Pedobacter sp. TaxID=1411316 RepID=UPI003C3FE536